MTVDLASVTLSSELLEAELHLRHRLRVGWSGKGRCKRSDRNGASRWRAGTPPTLYGGTHGHPLPQGAVFDVDAAHSGFDYLASPAVRVDQPAVAVLSRLEAATL
jgi:hypothetical protein